jgi:hypothetical protein
MKAKTKAPVRKRNAAEEPDEPEGVEIEDEEDTGDTEPPPERRDDPGLLERLWEQKTRTGRAALTGGELVERQRLSFDVPGDECAPGFFEDANGDPITVRFTMQSLTSGEEASVLNGLESPSQAGFLLAKACLWKLNGKVMDPDQKNLIWEGLGMKGRQLCFVAFQSLGSAAMASLGKSLQSYSID